MSFSLNCSETFYARDVLNLVMVRYYFFDFDTISIRVRYWQIFII